MEVRQPCRQDPKDRNWARLACQAGEFQQVGSRSSASMKCCGGLVNNKYFVMILDIHNFILRICKW